MPNVGYPSRRPKKLFFYTRVFKRNREAIDAKKKGFEHPRKKRTRRKKKVKKR